MTSLTFAKIKASFPRLFSTLNISRQDQKIGSKGEHHHYKKSNFQQFPG